LSSVFSARKERRKMQKDIKEKRLEEHNDVFADIFNNLLFDGKAILKKEDLTTLPTESYVRAVDGKLHEEHRDVRKADKDKNVYRLVCGIENQTDVENTMPERIMGYDYAAYEFQVREFMKENKEKEKSAYTKRIHDDQKLAPVVTAVLYWGNEWNGPLTLHDMLEFPQDTEEVIRPLVPDYPMNLVEVRKIPKQIREKLTSDFRLIAEYAARRQDPELLEELLEDKVHTIKHPEEFLDMLSEVAKDKQYKEVKEKLMADKEENVTMCVIADKLVKRGIEQGRLLGEKDGIERGGLLLVRALIKDGKIKLEEGARYLDISVEMLNKKLCDENLY